MVAPHEDREVQKAAKRDAKALRLEAQMVDNGLRDALDSIAGREFIWWLLRLCGMGTLPMGKDQFETYFHLGELNVGQQLLARIAEINPLAYALMQKEHIDRGRSSELPEQSEPDSGSDADA